MNEKDVEADLFPKLKSICVPLLAKSKLDPKTIPRVLSLLDELKSCTEEIPSETNLKSSLIQYIFFPLSSILSRNDSSSIPDQVIERVFDIISRLMRWWWWTCEDGVWEQLFMLSGSMLGATGGKGKRRDRSDETKVAAVNLLLELLRDRSVDEDVVKKGPEAVDLARSRLATLQGVSRRSKFVPIVGQTLNMLLITATSNHLPLKLSSLQAVELSIRLYLPNHVIPSILPGVVSTATRIALGYTDTSQRGKGWVNGSAVAASLRVLDCIILSAIGDEICTSLGLVHEMSDLEDLAELVSEPAASDEQKSNLKQYETVRTKSWMRGTASQVFIAVNTLTPLLSHPTASALLALSRLSRSLLANTRLTVPQLRPLLLSYLLSLVHAQYDTVSVHARDSLVQLLRPPNKGHHELLQVVVRHTSDNLSALPRLISSRADAKVIHVAKQVQAICDLAYSDSDSVVPSIQGIVAKLLGPMGGVEKWGWSLLSILDISVPTIADVPRTNLMLEEAYDAPEQLPFPEVVLRYGATRDTLSSLEGMLRALGRAGGDEGLFAVEWFVGVGQQSDAAASSVAFWCACRVLEGIVGFDLDKPSRLGVADLRPRGKRVEKFARSLGRTLPELWDRDPDEAAPPTTESGSDDKDMNTSVEFVKGLTPLETRLDLHTTVPSKEPRRPVRLPVLHKSFALQLLTVSAVVLRSRYNSLLIYVLYPILHSIVSSEPHLSVTAMAALQHISSSTGYASPANLLLSNFDYALDSVSRRLTRRWLDVDAAKVLVVLVRLVGHDVVQRAGDVVEECFDRLDDFHGYQVVVEGLLEALQEVVKAIETAEPLENASDNYTSPVDEDALIPDSGRIDALLDWIAHRRDPPVEEEEFSPYNQTQDKGKGKETQDRDSKVHPKTEDDPLGEPQPTAAQQLAAQIVSRSLYLLTHGSASIRARILSLLATAAPSLQQTALLPSVHRAWPFILNRLSDHETYVVSAAAGLIEALSISAGSFMTTRIWEDAWPRFRSMLASLDDADASSALARRRAGLVGTESAYSHSHRLYRAMMRTMTSAIRGGVRIRDSQAWEVLLAFRRFLHKGAHEELQFCARELYVAFGKNNSDAVWLVLTSTASTPGVPHLQHLEQTKWEVQSNVEAILHVLDSS